MSRPGVLLLFLVTAAFGAGGFIYGVQSRQRAARLDDQVRFLQTRVELLEEDAQRLLGLVDRLERAGAVDDPEAVIRRDLELVVSDLRGLPWRSRVPYKIVTADGLADLAREKLRGAPATAATARRQMRAWAAMGWADRDAGGEPPDWAQVVGRLYGGSATAFYDETQAVLHVARGAALEEAPERVLLVHELACALLDQHHDLAEFLAPERDVLWRDSDHALARRALVTGDASLLALRYNSDFGSALVTADGALTEFGALATLAGATAGDARDAHIPAVASALAVFPHTAGRSFCSAIAGGDGFTGIDAAYARPPSSTAEVLHPELYRDGGFVPRRFDWREEDFRVRGRAILWSDVAGELGVRTLLRRFLPDAAQANRAAAGWKGDRFIVFADAGGDDRAGGAEDVLWRSEWADAGEAREFHDALGAAMRTRYALMDNLNGIYDGARFLSLELTRDGTGVILVDAGTGERRVEMRERLR